MRNNCGMIKRSRHERATRWRAPTEDGEREKKETGRRLTCERRRRGRQSRQKRIYNVEWPRRPHINANGTDSGARFCVRLCFSYFTFFDFAPVRSSLSFLPSFLFFSFFIFLSRCRLISVCAAISLFRSAKSLYFHNDENSRMS